MLHKYHDYLYDQPERQDNKCSAYDQQDDCMNTRVASVFTLYFAVR